MNCKPGDLAIVFKGFPKCNIGKVIRCDRLVTAYGGEDWTYEGHLESGFPGYRVLLVADDCLKPLRPGDGQDETLSEKWAGLPKPVYVPAPEWVK